MYTFTRPLVVADSFHNHHFHMQSSVVTLQNFIKLPTVIDVFRELVPMVSLRGKIGSRRFHIFDKETLVNYDNPLVL